jgi:hypothetical protein
MSTPANIRVSDDLYRAVSDRADRTGVSAEDWATKVLAERVRLEQMTDEVFDRRARGASAKSLGELLSNAPDREPDPGDEFEI